MRLRCRDGGRATGHGVRRSLLDVSEGRAAAADSTAGEIVTDPTNAAQSLEFPMTIARRVRRARFNVVYWLLAHTQTGRAVLWIEWIKGQEFQRKVEGFDREFVPNCDTEGL